MGRTDTQFIMVQLHQPQDAADDASLHEPQFTLVIRLKI